MGCRNTKGVEYCDEELINEQYPYRRAYLGSHRTVGIRSDNRYSDITLVILLCVTIKKCENKFIVKLPPLQVSSNFVEASLVAPASTQLHPTSKPPANPTMDPHNSRFSPPYQRSHSRSRSPYSHTNDARPRHHSSRSRSPHRHHHRSHHRSHHRAEPSKSSKALPLGARPISKHDLEKYKSLLGLYLDIQKGLVFEELDEREVKGRWRSFVGKW
jgi:hypothetical protein